MNRMQELCNQYVGREWPCELEGDWTGYYPVVSERRVVAIYDAANQDPAEYARKLIVDDLYIDADAPDEIEDGLYDTAEAARLLGITEQRVRTLCADGRMGQRVGGVWVITGSNLRANQVRKSGRPKRFALHDWNAGEDIMCPVRQEQELTEGAVLLHVQHPDVGLVAVIAYPDGAQFTPSDWQGEQPQEFSDIARWQWVDQDGAPAILMNGLPRKGPSAVWIR